MSHARCRNSRRQPNAFAAASRLARSPDAPPARSARPFGLSISCRIVSTATFVRLEATRSLETEGAGLGLAIARSVARSHGEEIVLETRNDGGLRAILTLPRVAS